MENVSVSEKQECYISDVNVVNQGFWTVTDCGGKKRTKPCPMFLA